MQNISAKFLLFVGVLVVAFFAYYSEDRGFLKHPQLQDMSTTTEVSSANTEVNVNENLMEDGEVLGTSTTSIDGRKVYSNTDLLKMATAKLKVLPLGDNKYITSNPKVGYVYLCNVNKDSNQGAGTDGPWITGTTWVPSEKAHVDGKVLWSAAWFKNILSGAKRLITGNNLPLDHTTGVFPINVNSTAGKYDRNPNSIKTQTLSYSLNASPTYSTTPNCMGGEVGVMLSGVPLFNGFDAQQRDAQAHEVQDSCDGHPQEKGEYHYHGLSSCFSDTSITKVLGFALDGFPITGSLVSKDKYLHTEKLDICHGLTSEIIVDGKKKITYHYVMTEDFPYSASCFRGTPVNMGRPDGGQQPQIKQATGNLAPTNQTPPQAAIDACTGKSLGVSCTVQTPNGNITGSCMNTPNNSYFACIPNNR